jgi:hypothetical protein
MARALEFDVPDHSLATAEEQPVFSATPSEPKKRRSRKVLAPLVQPSSCHFTRSCLKGDGFRPKPLVDSQPPLKKKVRAKLLIPVQSAVLESSGGSGKPNEKQDDGAHDEPIPETPIKIMQNVGIALGISPQKLTVEQLEADPKIHKKNRSNDD